MIPDQVPEIIVIGKYVLIALSIIGLIVLIMGIYQKRRKFIERGAYMIILSIVLGICGYLIYDKTKERAYDMLNNTYITR